MYDLLNASNKISTGEQLAIPQPEDTDSGVGLPYIHDILLLPL